MATTAPYAISYGPEQTPWCGSTCRATKSRRLSWRTARRGVLRAELWNGNRESLRNFLRRDPERSILAWAWTTHRRNGDRYRAAVQDPAWSHMEFVRIASAKDIRSLLSRTR